MHKLVLFVLLALALVALARVPSVVSTDRVSIMCSGGGTRAGVGCTLALTFLREQQKAFWGTVRHLKGVSGGAWGVASTVLSAVGKTRMENVMTQMTKAKGSLYGPHVSSFRKDEDDYYDLWQDEIYQYFVEPFYNQASKDMTFGKFAKLARKHRDFKGIHLEFLTAGVASRKFKSAPGGWCAYTTKKTYFKCYHAKDAVNSKRAMHPADIGNQPLLQALAIASSAASTNQFAVKLMRQRKFPRIDESSVPEGFQFLVDAGHFNNLPFVPFSKKDNKILVLEYTDSGDSGPLSNFKNFYNWAKKSAQNRQIDRNIIFVTKNGNQLTTTPRWIIKKPDPDTIFFIIRTDNKYDNGERIYYFLYPFIGATKKHTLMKSFTTMTKVAVVRAYDSDAAQLFINEYNVALQDNLPKVLSYMSKSAKDLEALWAGVTTQQIPVDDEAATTDDSLDAIPQLSIETDQVTDEEEQAEAKLENSKGTSEPDTEEDEDEEEEDPKPKKNIIQKILTFGRK